MLCMCMCLCLTVDVCAHVCMCVCIRMWEYVNVWMWMWMCVWEGKRTNERTNESANECCTDEMVHGLRHNSNTNFNAAYRFSFHHLNCCNFSGGFFIIFPLPLADFVNVPAFFLRFAGDSDGYTIIRHHLLLFCSASNCFFILFLLFLPLALLLYLSRSSCVNICFWCLNLENSLQRICMYILQLFISVESRWTSTMTRPLRLILNGEKNRKKLYETKKKLCWTYRVRSFLFGSFSSFCFVLCFVLFDSRSFPSQFAPAYWFLLMRNSRFAIVRFIIPNV